MKHILICMSLLVAATLGAQQGPPKSPAATESATIAGNKITISYSSPRVNGRAGHIFAKDGLIGHDSTYPVWRAGANSATALHTEANFKFKGNVPIISKGDYTLYVDISDPDQWVLIVSKQTGQWGTEYDKAQDLLRVKMQMSTPPAPVENLTYKLNSIDGHRGELVLCWENHVATVPFFVK
jgi:hypothetical protein